MANRNSYNADDCRNNSQNSSQNRKNPLRQRSRRNRKRKKAYSIWMMQM